MNFLQFQAAFAGIVGALMLSLNLDLGTAPFVVMLGSSLTMMLDTYLTKQPWYFTMAAAYTLININGIVQWA